MSTIPRIITTLAIVTVSTLSITIFSGVTQVSAVSQVPENVPEQSRANERSNNNENDRRIQQDNNRNDRSRDASRAEQVNDERVERCEKQLKRIEQITATIASRATDHMAVFDRIHNRVETFYDTSPLDDPDYNDLNTAVVSARDTANSELALFTASAGDITCIGEDALLNPTKELRMRAKVVIEALQTYRSTLVQLIQSLRAEIANAEAEETTENDQSANEQLTD